MFRSDLQDSAIRRVQVFCDEQPHTPSALSAYLVDHSVKEPVSLIVICEETEERTPHSPAEPTKRSTSYRLWDGDRPTWRLRRSRSVEVTFHDSSPEYEEVYPRTKAAGLALTGTPTTRGNNALQSFSLLRRVRPPTVCHTSIGV